MVSNGREKLYENCSITGTLIVSIDNSTFHIRFYESLTVELDLNTKESQASTSIQSEPICEANNSLDTTVQWSGNKNVSPLQTVTKPDQKDVSVEDVLRPLDVYKMPESLCEKAAYDNAHQYTAKEVSSETNHLSKNGLTYYESDLDENEQLSTDDMLKETEDCHIVGNANSFPQFCNEAVKMESSCGGGIAQNDKHIDQDVSLIEILSQELPFENSIEDPNISKTNLSIPPAHYCDDCCKTFKTTQELKDHRKVKNVNEFNCDECCEVFPFKAFLQVHKKAHHGTSGASIVYMNNKYWYTCDDCGAHVKSLFKLQIHNLKHTKEGYFQCCLCTEKFGERLDLSHHLKCHKSGGIIRCRWCNTRFGNRNELARHKLNCKEIKCHLCGNFFPNKTSRNQHYKDFHPNDILKCEICAFMFSSQEELDIHMNTHSRVKKQQCTLCGLFFSKLKKHMLVHQNPAEITESELFYCDKCPAKFTRRWTFNRHMQRHSGDKPYQCPKCPKTFAHCGSLYKHIKRHASL